MGKEKFTAGEDCSAPLGCRLAEECVESRLLRQLHSRGEKLDQNALKLFPCTNADANSARLLFSLSPPDTFK